MAAMPPDKRSAPAALGDADAADADALPLGVVVALADAAEDAADPEADPEADALLLSQCLLPGRR